MKETARDAIIRVLSLFVVIWLVFALTAWLIASHWGLDRLPSDMTQYGFVVQSTIFVSAVFAALLSYWRTFELGRQNDLQQDTLLLDELSRSITFLSDKSETSQTAGFVQLMRIWDTDKTHRPMISQAVSSFLREQARGENHTNTSVVVLSGFLSRLNNWNSSYHFGEIEIRKVNSNSDIRYLRAMRLGLNQCTLSNIAFKDSYAFRIRLKGAVSFSHVTFENVNFDGLEWDDQNGRLSFENCKGKIIFGEESLDTSAGGTYHNKIELGVDLKPI